MNSSGNITACQLHRTNVFIPIFLSFVFFIGFVLNCISSWIFWFKIKQWNAMVVLQFNLAISDFLITLIAPLNIIYYLTDHWTFGLFLCQFRMLLLNTNIHGSIYFLTLISIHRYLSVTQDKKRQKMVKKSFITKLCLAIWGFLICQGIPFFFILKLSTVQNMTKCFNIQQDNQTNLYFALNWIALFIGVLTPFFITLVCYTLLIRYILRVNPMNTLSKVMLSKSVRTIFFSVIFIFFCLPYHIARTISLTIMFYSPINCSLLERVNFAYLISAAVSLTNCCLDPILYCFASDRFKRIFTRWCSFLQKQNHISSDNTYINYVNKP